MKNPIDMEAEEAIKVINANPELMRVLMNHLVVCSECKRMYDEWLSIVFSHLKAEGSINKGMVNDV